MHSRKLASVALTVVAACGPGVATTESSTTENTSGSTTTPSTSTPTTSADPSTTTDLTTTGTSDTSGTTTDDLTTGDSTTDPACLEISITDPRDFPEQPHFTCGLPALCAEQEPLVFLWEVGGWTVSDIERARCMAAALRDRTPGQLRYQDEENDDFHTLEILGEQVIVVREYHGIGFGFSYDEHIASLDSSLVFANCLNGTADDLHTCIRDAFTDVCAETRECPS